MMWVVLALVACGGEDSASSEQPKAKQMKAKLKGTRAKRKGWKAPKGSKDAGRPLGPIQEADGGGGPPFSGRDLTGSYTGMGSLDLVQGDNGKVLAYYSAVFGNGHLCDCLLDESAFEVNAKTIGFAGGLDCCGAGWPGDSFPIAKRTALSTCTVTADKAAFYTGPPDMSDPTGAYVVKGDEVEVFDFVVETPAKVARYPKSKTLGFLKPGDLSCR